MKSLILPALCGLSLLLSVPTQADATKNCHIGSYRLNGGQAFDIAPSDGDALRWRAFTGETGRLAQNKDGSWTSTFGWTDKPDGKTVSFSDCTKGEITFGTETGKRIAFDVSETTFESGGTKLIGRRAPVASGIRAAAKADGLCRWPRTARRWISPS